MHSMVQIVNFESAEFVQQKDRMTGAGKDISRRFEANLLEKRIMNAFIWKRNGK